MAAGRTPEARPSFQKALNGFEHPSLPDKITPANLVDPLAQLMLGKLPAADLTDKLPKMPDWAGAFTQFLLGLKQYEAGNLDEARDSFLKYEQLPVDNLQLWAYALQPLAGKLATDIQNVPACARGHR